VQAVGVLLAVWSGNDTQLALDKAVKGGVVCMCEGRDTQNRTAQE